MYADIAPSHVDRDADMIEHVLDETMLERLRARLRGEEPLPSHEPIVASPHALQPESPTAPTVATVASATTGHGQEDLR
jgi:Mn-dependent DtxR family transcriptional regulator